MAAGLSIARDNLDEFRRRINANANLTQDDFFEKVKIDVPMPMYYPTLELAREFELLAPYGNGNPRPLFMDKCVKIARMWVVGKNQNVLRLSLSSSDGRPISAIYFGNIELFMDYLREKYSSEDVELALRGKENRLVISVVYAPRINTFRDEENLQAMTAEVYRQGPRNVSKHCMTAEEYKKLNVIDISRTQMTNPSQFIKEISSSYKDIKYFDEVNNGCIHIEIPQP